MYLEFPTDRNNCVSPMNQLLLTLRLYSTGGHLLSVADFCGVHVSTACRIVRRVSEAIARLYRQYIQMATTPDDMMACQREFFNIASFPRVVGVIDCTHIKIDSPGGEDPEIFRNRKGYFSINVQMICDANLKIMNVVARWPGSSHDSTIFSNSRVRVNFEQNIYENCLLLGDSGYPNRRYLMTPLLNPATPAQQLYNEAHIRTRNCIERCFGVIKRRFPILAYGCRLLINSTLSIIMATSVLHNKALQVGDLNVPNLPDEVNIHELDVQIQNGNIPVPNMDGIGIVGFRHELINNYFANL
ncbi:putative nuclease HARBI1 [Photinus pyralis]|nr:putative nuclease HARBI1 [Photinus pyralis]